MRARKGQDAKVNQRNHPLRTHIQDLTNYHTLPCPLNQIKYPLPYKTIITNTKMPKKASKKRKLPVETEMRDAGDASRTRQNNNPSPEIHEEHRNDRHESTDEEMRDNEPDRHAGDYTGQRGAKMHRGAGFAETQTTGQPNTTPMEAP